jgi:hypothetical protein
VEVYSFTVSGRYDVGGLQSYTDCCAEVEREMEARETSK